MSRLPCVRRGRRQHTNGYGRCSLFFDERFAPCSEGDEMHIGAINGTDIATNSSYASGNEQAKGANFERMLNDLQTKARAAQGNHAVNAAAKSKQDAALQEACKGFEAMFLNMMYREMRSTVPENDIIKKSNAIKIFEDMRDTEMTKKIADGGGIGLGDLIYKQLAPTVLAQEQAWERMKENGYNG